MNVSSALRRRARVGGYALIAATLLFAAVFTYLAAAFSYPDVLDGPAAEVLPALLQLGTTGRLVWVLYGVIPLLLIPTARGVAAIAAPVAPRLGRAAIWLAAATAVAMMTGLLRWPTLNWGLAHAWPSADAAARTAMAERFAAGNFYLGNVIGEFVGELCLNAFFLVSALALVRAQVAGRWFLYVGAAASALGWIAMLRNLTPLVAGLAEINNSVLPVWMLVMGVVMTRARIRR